MKQRILVADDDPAILKTIKTRLEFENYDVVAAADGEEVLQHVLSEEKFDLILLDVRMPKLDGLQVCKQLKENPLTKNIPIIIFTASSERWKKLIDQCFDLGVSFYLKKPFQTKKLIEKVIQAIKESSREA